MSERIENFREWVAIGAVLIFALIASPICRAKDAFDAWRTRHGLASWYGDECRGRKMANGKPFDPDALTCGAWDWPLGSKLLVVRGDREVIVTVTDRGPRFDLVEKGRLVDLSRRAFEMIANPDLGLIQVTIKKL